MRVARFILVGALNTGFSFALYALLLWLGLHYTLANFTAMCCGTIFSFVTQGRLVFDNPDPRRYGRFVAAWVATWIFNIALIEAFVELGGLDAYTAGAVALVPVVALSYLIQKHLVFSSRAG